MSTILDLPREILLHILKLYLKTESQYNLMRAVCKVNGEFKSLCFDSFLWETVDGTLSFDSMMLLIQHGSFSMTKNFTISKIDELSEKKATCIFTNLKNVNVLNLSPLKKFKDSLLEVISTNCSKLTQIHFGKPEHYLALAKRVSYGTLGPFLAVRGANLLCLDLSYCHVQNMPLVIRCIADCCPSLEELLLVSVYANALFPTKYMQTKCPKLKVLCLDHNVRPSADRYSDGFPNLTAFSFFDPDGTVMYDQKFLSILFNSSQLNILNIPNCNVSSVAVCQLPAKDVEFVNLSKSKACVKDLEKVIEKWCHSLKELNVSYCKSSALDKAVSKLVAIPEESHLEVLNLSYTTVGPDVVKSILVKCNKLRVLHLESCRNLVRGMKRVYYGTSELHALRKKLDVATSLECE